MPTNSTNPETSPSHVFAPVAPPSLKEALLATPARDRYAHAALAALPRLIGLMDKNPLSRTYGSFDRSYWHYRTMDFPCGMSQEFVLPLTLAYAWDLPGGERWRGNDRLRELAVAAMHFARSSSHSDATCDDYFPFERAMGALVFSLYAMTESCLQLDMKDNPRESDNFPALLDFFAKRGDHLGRENETGQLANHQALAALALYNVHLLTGEEKYRTWSDQRRDLTLSWQHEEGWFQEYEGADPGYHSCSIDFLGKLRQKSGDDDILLPPLRRAADFSRYFMHPDGSYAGEYGSRNTFHFYPHGFELLAAEGHGPSREIADLFLTRSLPESRRYFNDDDRMCAHYVYNWMQAWRDFSPRDVEEPAPMKPEKRFFPGAGLGVVVNPSYHGVINVRKGGVLKAFTEKGPWLSNTGPMLKLDDGKVHVAHLMKDEDPESQSFAPSDGGKDVWEARSAGRFDKRKHQLANPWTQIVFRFLTLTIGRFNANLVRSTLQKILITGKRPSPFTFERRVRFLSDSIEIEDKIENPEKTVVTRYVEAPDSTSIYVANSNTFQESVLLPAKDAPEIAKELSNSGAVTVKAVHRLPGA